MDRTASNSTMLATSTHSLLGVCAVPFGSKESNGGAEIPTGWGLGKGLARRVAAVDALADLDALLAEGDPEAWWPSRYFLKRLARTFRDR